MENQEMKLQKIKKSCKVSATILKVFSIIVLVLAVAFFTGATLMLANAQKVNNYLVSDESGDVGESLIETFGDVEMESSIDALQEFMDDCKYPIVMICASYLYILGIALVVVLIALSILRKVFVVIYESGTPFSVEVLKKLKKVFIFITIFMFLTTGGIMAIITAMILFCIYNIFSYGVSLQELSDETL